MVMDATFAAPLPRVVLTDFRVRTGKVQGNQVHSITGQTGDMKRHPGNGIEGAMVCANLGSLLRPLFYFLDDVSYPQ